MVGLIIRDIPQAWNAVPYAGFFTEAEYIVPGPNGIMPYPTLCPHLRETLASCLATNPAIQPTLPKLLEQAVAGANSPPESFPNPQGPGFESDDFIRTLLKPLIYDADLEVAKVP